MRASRINKPDWLSPTLTSAYSKDLNSQKLIHCPLFAAKPLVCTWICILTFTYIALSYVLRCAFRSCRGPSTLWRRTQEIRVSLFLPAGPVCTGHFLLCLLSARLPRKDSSQPIRFKSPLPWIPCLVGIKVLWHEDLNNPLHT